MGLFFVKLPSYKAATAKAWTPFVKQGFVGYLGFM
jgi:hypothetical protein